MSYDQLRPREAAELDYIEQYQAVTRNMTDTAFRETAEMVHAVNTMRLTELQEFDDQLDIPEIAEQHGVLMQTSLEARPLNWMPYAPALVEENLTARDGVMAISGWAITPKNSTPRQRNLDMLVGLYHYGNFDSDYSPPRLVVTSLHHKTDKTQSISVAELLQQDSALSHDYNTLVTQRDTASKVASIQPPYYRAAMEWGKHVSRLPHADSYLQMLYTNWELGQPDGPPQRGRDTPPMTLDRHVEAANTLLDAVKNRGFPIDLVPPEALDGNPDQSWRTLPIINALFAPEVVKAPGRLDRWLKRKRIIQPAGAVASAVVVVTNLHEAQDVLRDKVSVFYSQTSASR